LATGGALDASFGNGGVVVTRAVSPVGATNVALQTDGKIVVVAALSDSSAAAQVFGVVRYMPNGTLDLGFGSRGVVRTAFTPGFNAPTSVAIAADGKIVVVGSASTIDNSSSALAIARYATNGTLDASFGSAGLVTTTLLGKRDVANVVAVQPDGKILVGGRALTAFGRAGIDDTALVRYDTAGRLDATFGQEGKVIANAAGSVTALAVEPDRSILALGVDRAGRRAVARFSAAGAALPVALSGQLAAVAATGSATFQPDGSFLVASTVRGASRFDVDVRIDRIALAGAPDPAFHPPVFDFASPGIANRPNVAQALLVQPNGAILAGGIAGVALGVTNLGLARFVRDGQFDAAFGNGGIVTTPITGRNDQIFALARQSDGKILAVGLTTDATTGATAVALARYFGN
jgi:uncharacterized delta-60 repeat protein